MTSPNNDGEAVKPVEIDDGGMAFPDPRRAGDTSGFSYEPDSGISVRDYFAAHVQADDRLVKCVRAMDDTTLLIFAQHPTLEREEWITETGELCGLNAFIGKSEVNKVILRLELEAHAIAKVRYMQADAMLQARKPKAVEACK